MVTRWLEALIEDPSLDPKMRFVAGPRQAGKTTLARSILKKNGSERLLFNWDVPAIRRRYREDSLFYRADMKGLRKRPIWTCFDEVHKQRRWKNILKGVYDADGDKLSILVTGSARLDLFRRAGDSLAGRFFLFHLSPMLLGELLVRPIPAVPSTDPREWIGERLYPREEKAAQEAFEQIWRYGPFPEPLLKANSRFASLWRRNYLDSVVQGDMRDLTRIRDLDLVESLIDLLPWRVGAPFSANAVREDLEVAQATVKRMMNHLERLMFTFSLAPYTKKVSRPVKKERKVYLYDWSSIEDPGARFENFVAVELQAHTRLWTESGGDEWNLQFVRNREGKETDFLILRRRKPWCLLECKTRKSKVESHHLLFAKKLGNLPVVQLLREHGALRAKDRDLVSISASRFLA